MRNILFQAVCKVGIFMICAQAMIHFRPQESYEKYLKLLVSVMILIQLFLPVGSFLLGDGMGETAARLEQFMEELEADLSLSAQEAADTDEMLERMTLEEVRKRMEEQEREAEEGGGGEQEPQVGTVSGEEDGGKAAEDPGEDISITVEPVVIGSGE